MKAPKDTITLTLTVEEAHLAGYALKELANRRFEQAVDMPNSKDSFTLEGAKCYELGTKLYDAAK
jgi:hypothetical protein